MSFWDTLKNSVDPANVVSGFDAKGTPLHSTISAGSSVVNTVSTGVTDTFSVTKFLSQGSAWKAIGLIIAGVIMLILAVVEFTAGSGSVITMAAAAAA